MPDITVFKLEIDDSTFNAPFGGRARSDGAPTTDESSGPNVKLVAGLGVVFLLTGGALVFVLKRRFGSSDDDDDDDEDVAIDISETDGDEDVEESEEAGGIRAMIGLSFLVGTTAVVKRKLGIGAEKSSRTI